MLTASPTDIVALLNHNLSSLWAGNPTHTVSPLMLWGAPGVGKSAIVKTVAKNHDIPLIDVRLSQREPVDLRGIPVPDGDRTRWLVSSEWPTAPQIKGILFLDELTAADRAMQAAAYELVLDRKLGEEYTLPDGWLVVAAGNRRSDGAVAHTMSSALANRFCHLNVEASPTSWLAWAEQEHIHTDVIEFIRNRPDMLFSMEGNCEQGWPSPRSWERVAHVLREADKAKLPKSLIELQIFGLIGQGTAAEFLGFMQDRSEVTLARKLLETDSGIVLPDRSDKLHAFVAAMTGLVADLGSAAITKWPRIMQIADKLPDEHAVLMVTNILGAVHRNVSSKLVAHPCSLTWSTRHQNYLGVNAQADGPMPGDELFTPATLFSETA